MVGTSTKNLAPAEFDFGAMNIPDQARPPEPGRSPQPAARSLRIALAGGGTGGHIVPGLHLLATPRARELLADVVWFQTGRAVEARVLAGAEERLAPAMLERVTLSLEPEGGGAPSLARLACCTLPAVLRARGALRRHRSQVLVGLGGFTSLPAVLAARSLGLPVALLEINAHAGRATRWLAPWSTRVLHAWRATLPAERNPRDVWVGPPLAPEFTAGEPKIEAIRQARSELGFDPDRPLLAVLGGSQGARAVNAYVREHAPFWTLNGVTVVHQVGPGRLEEGLADLEGYTAVEYVQEVAKLLRATTLVLCRGGASTLAEIGALRRPAWIVPYPHHADRHQERNARELGRGARIVQESELSLELAREVLRFCGAAGAPERAAMSAALAGVVPQDGAAHMFDQVLELATHSTPRFQSDTQRL